MGALFLAWFLPLAVFARLGAQSQATKKPDKYALTGVEQVNAEAVCISLKYRKDGEAAYYQCLGIVMDEMRAAKKLRYFEGSWVLRGKVRASPWSKPGQFTRSERNEWEEKDWALVSHWNERQPGGVASGITTFEHDQKQKLYTFHEESPTGAKRSGTGTCEKTGAWTWVGSTRLADGKPVRSRWIVDPISDASYRFRSEIATPKGAWIAVLEGTARKSR